MRILIAGAGIGGLTTALSLHAAGFTDIRLVEATGTSAPSGLGLNVLPDAVRELSELGLLERLAGKAVRTAELRLFNRHGRLIWTEPRGVAAGYRWPQLSVSRRRLWQVLTDAVHNRLGPETVAFGTRVVGCVPEQGAPAEVTLQEGRERRTALADLVIGADGVHSAIRAALHPGEGPPPGNGVMMWRGTTWAPPFLSGRTMAVVGDDVRRIVLYPIAEDPVQDRVLVNWVAAHPSASAGRADWHERAPLAAVLSEFDDWAVDWIDLAAIFRNAPAIYRYPMVDRDPLPWWSAGNVTLLGDAAHAMYPMGSNGATQSILDARTLAQALAITGDPVKALADYERRRLPAMTRLQESNRGWGPEAIITMVHQRAPDGFTDLDDVVSPAELTEVATRYASVSGAQVHQVNHRPSLSTGDRTAAP
ncbi:FAD-dependent monooxygenase [Lentzea sp. DG1S-22]|uniref:FAD-dependent monooxygenase n=1 Tax=Lentzea sp. DG1S-22 TaxID=3108822 RepID=UPI002E7639F0|nr:FAD-dependent monooxygenase [Lentzea sp. DG1S-22]WVH82422.1 FAD-dependent monooxygenase [Lentzea sp. DG1S-22]